MEMNGNKICDADLSVQMLNDNPMHLKLKKKKEKRSSFPQAKKKQLSEKGAFPWARRKINNDMGR